MAHFMAERTAAKRPAPLFLEVSWEPGLGLVESSQSNLRNWESLEAKYVQSIDLNQRIPSA
jgi:hypothetical protein